MSSPSRVPAWAGPRATNWARSARLKEIASDHARWETGGEFDQPSDEPPRRAPCLNNATEAVLFRPGGKILGGRAKWVAQYRSGEKRVRGYRRSWRCQRPFRNKTDQCEPYTIWPLSHHKQISRTTRQYVSRTKFLPLSVA